MSSVQARLELEYKTPDRDRDGAEQLLPLPCQPEWNHIIHSSRIHLIYTPDSCSTGPQLTTEKCMSRPRLCWPARARDIDMSNEISEESLAG